MHPGTRRRRRHDAAPAPPPPAPAAAAARVIVSSRRAGGLARRHAQQRRQRGDSQAAAGAHDHTLLEPLEGRRKQQGSSSILWPPAAGAWWQRWRRRLQPQLADGGECATRFVFACANTGSCLAPAPSRAAAASPPPLLQPHACAVLTRNATGADGCAGHRHLLRGPVQHVDSHPADGRNVRLGQGGWVVCVCIQLYPIDTERLAVCSVCAESSPGWSGECRSLHARPLCCAEKLPSSCPSCCCSLPLQAFEGFILSAFFAGYAATQVLGGEAGGSDSLQLTASGLWGRAFD